VKQDECICTTTTCGAGMLDAGAAVAAAIADSTFTGPAPTYTWPTAAVTAATTSTMTGSGITLDGSTSTPGSSGAAVTYKWSIPDGDNAITLGATTDATVTVTGAAAGTGQVLLSVTDPTSGLTNSTMVSINVTAAPPHSGGGGAANPAWLAALAVAGLLLRPRARRARA
jgi:serine protease